MAFISSLKVTFPCALFLTLIVYFDEIANMIVWRVPIKLNRKVEKRTILSSLPSKLENSSDLPVYLQPGRFHAEWHPKSKKERFLSVQERVRLYMSAKWYILSELISRCDAEPTPTPFHRISTNQYQVGDIIVGDEFVANAAMFLSDQSFENSGWMSVYVEDAMEIVKISSVHTRYVPILVQMGDLRMTQVPKNVPIFKKFRFREPPYEPKSLKGSLNMPDYEFCKKFGNMDKLNFKLHDAIVWTLNKEKHYGTVPDVIQNDIPWEEKQNKAVYRGAAHLYGKIDVNKICRNRQRCTIAYLYHSSDLVDAGVQAINHKNIYVRGKKITKDSLSMKELLKYKMIIMLEGNDVATGLKWALFSSTVVLMPEPMLTSWAMEELLEPWVHYIPLNSRLTDVEEKVQWVIDHDEDAKRIAERATLWIHDLLFEESSQWQEQKVKEELVRRYKSLFIWDHNDQFH